jgi:hypothetical protein
MGVRIGPCRIADATGTHEPGEVIANPSQALIDLAEAKTKDPESGKVYVEMLSDAKTTEAAIAALKAAEPAPKDKD